MRQRIEALQAQHEAQGRALAKRQEQLDNISHRLNVAAAIGFLCVIVAMAGIGIVARGLADRGRDQSRLASDNRVLIDQVARQAADLRGFVAKTQIQREKSAENACLTRAIQNSTLIRAFVPPEVVARASKKDRETLAGPDDCAAYGRSVTTDGVPPPVPGTKSKGAKRRGNG